MLSQPQWLIPGGSGAHLPFQDQYFCRMPVLLLGAWRLSRCRRGEHGHRVGPEWSTGQAETPETPGTPG